MHGDMHPAAIYILYLHGPHTSDVSIIILIGPVNIAGHICSLYRFNYNVFGALLIRSPCNWLRCAWPAAVSHALHIHANLLS